MTSYKCVFFDLDHTLWDYEKNSREALLDIYDHFKLDEKGVDNFDRFHARFREVNLTLWDLYDRGVIQSETIRTERFKQILDTFNAHENIFSQQISDHYLHICPDKMNLMPNTLEVLTYLSGRYKLSIVTNGFEEIQHRKLRAGKLAHFFDHIVTSQKTGHKKPAREIFQFALKANNINPAEAIMIGDNLITDIGGARNAAIDAVFFNPDLIAHQETVKHEIQNLNEIYAFL